MMSEWSATTLGSLTEEAGGFIKTGPFGSQLHASEYMDDPSGIPVVMPKDMVNHRVNRTTVARVSGEVAKRLSAHRLVQGDLVLARRGELGRLAAIAADEQGWICGTGSIRIHAPDQEVANSDFLRYLMASESTAAWLQSQSVGATMSNLNAKIVGRLPVALPPADGQERIAAVLSAFDELIEINERRIELLEDLARSLYREWFVHFRFPGHENVRMIDSELGPIPEGWTAGNASELFEVNPKAVTRQAEYAKFAMADISEHLSHARPSGTTTKFTGSKFTHGDVLFARITPCLENGKTGLALSVKKGRVAVGSTEFIVLRGRTVGPAFSYCFARNQRVRSAAISSMSGADGRQRVARNFFETFRTPIPPDPICGDFEDLAMPMLKLVASLRQVNDANVANRDILLPRLVTGKLDISELDLGVLEPVGTA